MTRVVSAGVAALLALASVLMIGPPHAVAQESTADAVVRGRVTMGSSGARLEGAVEVELIILEGSEASGSVKTPVTNGAYEVRIPAAVSRTYVPRVNYLNVNYFADPIRFTGPEREFTRDITVYATTDRPNALRLIQTIVTVIGIDPKQGHIGLLREDVLGLAGDRVYIGGTGGVTLRLPAPTGTEEASEEDGNGTLANGVLSVTTPIRPGSAASIITSTYLVKYDPAIDRYRLRVTVPVPAESVVARVPRDYVRAVRPVVPATKGDEQVLEDEDHTVLTVVQRARVDAGQSLLVDIDGVAGELQHHPLTEQPGASIAAATVLAIVGAAGALIWRRRGAAA
ncbi:MAG: hypothetical protein EPO16_04240 [Dehalococcoidia bacterium]|nr:MAG: hypothetical protein EPO16_04240 [Dehalococcoidia bacterium]